MKAYDMHVGCLGVLNVKLRYMCFIHVCIRPTNAKAPVHHGISFLINRDWIDIVSRALNVK